MYSADVQQVRVPEISDTFERTSTPVSNPHIRRVQSDWRVNFSNSRYLKSQNVFDAFDSEIERLRYTQANWNSYGSPAPSDIAIENARPILQALRTKLLQPERVLPSADGGVAFTFVSDTISRAAIEALNDGQSYVLLYDLNGNSDTVEWPVTQAEQLALIGQLAAHLRSNGIAPQGE